MKFTVYNELTEWIEVEAEDADHAVRIARDTDRRKYTVGDHDEVWVEDANGEEVQFDWTVVEALPEQEAANA